MYARLLTNAPRLFLLTALCGGCCLACRPRHARFEPPLAVSSADEGRQPPSAAPEQAFSWAAQTASPDWVPAGATNLTGCSGHERALTEVAGMVAERRAAGVPSLDMGEIAVELRARGSPHVWPRVWTHEAESASASGVDQAFAAWLGRLPAASSRRCGVAQARARAGSHVVAVIVVEPLADLDPFPATARSGQWLRFSARLHEPAHGAEVVVLGPRGAPRVAPTSSSASAARATFSLGQPGLWRVQLLLGARGGPRPALEAWVFVDEPPRRDATLAPAPGEIEVALGSSPSSGSALLEMMNAARLTEQLFPLQRDERLDALARAHAEAMRASGQAAHDAGDGSPVERVQRAAYPALRVGENVAQAQSLARAHRILWNSPSHRGNLLDPSFDRVGVGVVVEPAGAPNDTLHDGLREARREVASSSECNPSPGAPAAGARACRVWVCQLFVDSAPVKNAGSGRMSRRVSTPDNAPAVLLHNEEEEHEE